MTKPDLSRTDGRQFNELRPISFEPGYVTYPEGSVMVNWGNTRVLCNLTIQEGVPSWLAGTGQGWMTAEYALLPRSTHTRTPRETQGLKGRTQEIRRLIGRSLRMAVDLDKIGERTLLLDCDVIQADGGTRVASVTGGFLALWLALQPLIKAGMLTPDALKNPIAAVSVGMVNHQPVLDLNYAEDSQAEVDLNVVMTADGRFIEVQGTAENEPFSQDAFDQMLALARHGIDQILTLQSDFLQSL
ncbi:MAG: ribonuclease PH [Anaerolineae bacterium]|jgi:ribonuclease PH|nr:ribonuclease PH [Anaerolineae bacterium]